MPLIDGHRSGFVRPLLLAVFLGGFAADAAAQTRTGYYFMRLPASAPAAATANGALTPGTPDTQQFLYNPAVLSETHHRHVRLSYINHVGNLNLGSMAYAHQFSGIGTLGAAVRYLGYGSMTRTNESGERIGSFGASDVAVSAGLGRQYTEHVRVGLTGHLISSAIDDLRATALALDAGVLYHYAPFELTVGASLNNLGNELSGLGNSSVEVPLDVRLYATKQLQYIPLQLSIIGYNLNRIGARSGVSTGDLLVDHVRFGGELQLGSSLQIRFGYNPRRHRDLSTSTRIDLAGVTAGFGLNLYRVSFDYTYESWSSFGGLHYLTVGTKL